MLLPSSHCSPGPTISSHWHLHTRWYSHRYRRCYHHRIVHLDLRFRRHSEHLHTRSYRHRCRCYCHRHTARYRFRCHTWHLHTRWYSHRCQRCYHHRIVHLDLRFRRHSEHLHTRWYRHRCRRYCHRHTARPDRRFRCHTWYLHTRWYSHRYRCCYHHRTAHLDLRFHRTASIFAGVGAIIGVDVIAVIALFVRRHKSIAASGLIARLAIPTRRALTHARLTAFTDTTLTINKTDHIGSAIDSQPPQWAGSLARSVHSPSHRVEMSCSQNCT